MTQGLGIWQMVEYLPKMFFSKRAGIQFPTHSYDDDDNNDDDG